MGENEDIPPFVMRLPAPFRRRIASECGGDWRRVTLDDDGGVTVHNRPQRRSQTQLPSERVPEAREKPRKPLLPELPPLPTPLWAKPPQIKRDKPAPVAPSTFTRVQLPTAKPKGRKPAAVRRAPVPMPPPPPPEPVRQVPPAAPPASIIDPFLARTTSAPPPLPAVIEPVAGAQPVAAAEAGKRRHKRRTGNPRTAKEMLGQLLDLGCTYRRVQENGEAMADVKYQGAFLAQVHGDEGAPREVVLDDYRRVHALVQARKFLSE